MSEENVIVAKGLTRIFNKSLVAVDHVDFTVKAGVLYPYVGNVFGHKYKSTYCPDCGELVIQRLGGFVRKSSVTEDNKCLKCRHPIPIRGSYVRKSQAYFVA